MKHQNIEERLMEYNNALSPTHLLWVSQDRVIRSRVTRETGEGVLTGLQISKLAYLLGYDKTLGTNEDSRRNQRNITKKIPSNCVIIAKKKEKDKIGVYLFKEKGVKQVIRKMADNNILEYSEERFLYALRKL